MEQLLTTKLYIPPIRPKLVPRPRLVEQLNEGARSDCKLTLISAPAGYGKSTLVGEWVNQLRLTAADEDPIQLRIAWLSLDEDDNDLARFLAYFIAALTRVEGLDAASGEVALGKLQSPQQPPIESVLTSVINELADLPNRIVLILDDYHLIEAQPIHDALAYLLEHLPPQLHLVIATREDPLIPLARLRARCQLTELRAADLRFTRSEAAEFLNQVMGLNLSAEDIAALEDRTEGWIAGLQLAAVSLQGQTDKSKLIQSFTGSNRFVLDYLIEDVLSRQPVSLQEFLLRTSILRRLTGPLCDVVRFDSDTAPTGQEDGQAILEMLDRANLFVVPLDNERRWYRYHHLFADLLRQRLRQTQPEQQPILHLRASEWYEDNGFTGQAIEHALRAGEFERAAVLAEQAWREMHMNYGGITWLRWVEAMPDELVRARPVLSTGYGWSLIDTGDLEGADRHLEDAEQWLDANAKQNEKPKAPSSEKIELNRDALRSLSASIANARAYLTQARGDVAATEKYAQRALELLPEDDYFERGLSAVLTGFAYWSSGNLEAAHRAISEAISNMLMLGKITFIISFTSYLADIMIAQGHLNEAKKTYLQLLDTTAEPGESELQETAVVHLGLSELFHEQSDLQTARRHLERSEALGELPTFPPWYRHWVHAQVRIKETDGDLDGIFKILNESERLYYRHPIPDVRPLAALKAQAQLLAGRLAEAWRWVDQQGLSVDDDLSYLQEFEHLTLARVLIAQHKSGYDGDSIHDTNEFLGRLLNAAEEGNRMGSAIEILALQALAYEAQGKVSKALVPLERALTLAEPEGYVQTFTSEGAPMEALLKKIKPDDARLKEYVDNLLDAFGEKESHPPDARPSIDPLSEREIEVLEHIADGLTNPEIAARLYLSLNTVKVHTRNIYSKLGVSNRTQAVSTGRTLGILASN